MGPDPNEGQKASMVAGDDFLAVVSKEGACLHRYQWNEKTFSWDYQFNDLATGTSVDDRCSIAGTNNYFVSPSSNNWVEYADPAETGIPGLGPVGVSAHAYAWYYNEQSGQYPFAKIYHRTPVSSSGWSESTPIWSFNFNNDSRKCLH
jgi:hypothetical protein